MADKETPEEIDYKYHPLLTDVPADQDNKRLSFFEMVKQAFCLVFALQKGSGFKRAADLLDTNPKTVIITGFISMIIFFLFCFITSQLIIRNFT